MKISKKLMLGLIAGFVSLDYINTHSESINTSTIPGTSNEKDLNMEEEVATYNGKKILMKHVIKFGNKYLGIKNISDYNPSVISIVLIQMFYGEYVVKKYENSINKEDLNDDIEAIKTNRSLKIQQDTIAQQASKGEINKQFVKTISENVLNSQKAYYLVLDFTDAQNVENTIVSLNRIDGLTASKISSYVKKSSGSISVVPLRSSLSDDQEVNISTFAEITSIFKQKDKTPLSTSQLKKGSKIQVYAQDKTYLLIILDVQETTAKDKERLATIAAFSSLSTKEFVEYLKKFNQTVKCSQTIKDEINKLTEKVSENKIS